jgi:diacylglycerol kinase family enzyme
LPHLDVTLFAPEGLGDAVGAALHLYLSAQAQNPAERHGIGYLPVRRVTVRTDPPQVVLIDGDEAGDTPITVECRPSSLRVLAPRLPDAPAELERDLEGLDDLEVEPKD